MLDTRDLAVGDVVRVLDDWDLSWHGDIGGIGRQLSHILTGAEVEPTRTLSPGETCVVVCEPLRWLVMIENWAGYKWSLPPRLLEKVD